MQKRLKKEERKKNKREKWIVKDPSNTTYQKKWALDNEKKK